MADRSSTLRSAATKDGSEGEREEELGKRAAFVKSPIAPASSQVTANFVFGKALTN